MTRATKQEWEAVDNYLIELLAPPDEALNAALRDSHAAGLPSINVTANQGKFLQLLVRAIGAKRVLEIGTLGAYSTIWLARALPPDGTLITLEADPRHVDVARANIVRAGLDRLVDIRLGRALETLPQIATEGVGPFDFVFIDADKPSYPDYFQWALRLARAGTVIVADNVIRGGEVGNPSSDDPNVRGVQRMLEVMAKDPRISATALQTVCGKGYDGFAMGVVTHL